MFRYRRYRVFLVFAIVVVIALYKFGRSGTTWREAASTAAELKNEAEDALGFGPKPRPPIAHETKKLELHIPAALTSQALQTPPPVKKIPTPSPSSPDVTHKPSIPSPALPPPHLNQHSVTDSFALSTTIKPIHWSKLPEKFPVPPHSIIRLPSGIPKAIPRIQPKFKPEEDEAKADRLAKLDKIKTVFKKSWSGYKEFAWLHDELMPTSGTSRDPFANWGATLVDSLDTLWIMGLKEEFEEAVIAVNKIDFTTTTRADIPMFETTIRYLGGLIAAYDISGNSYQTLIDKAVELAEVLLSAFDTPNRMPLTYYYWRPQFASQKRRADTRVVLAEIGSLSMEFTRLAQITGENKYYDAIARITNNLEEFQNNTKLPGMWPTYLDASGCGKVYVDSSPQEPLKAPLGFLGDSTSPSPTEELSPEGKKMVPLHLPDPVVLSPNGVNPTFVPPTFQESITPEKPEKGTIRNWEGKPLERRQLATDLEFSSDANSNVDMAPPSSVMAAEPSIPTPPECIQQGFVSASAYGREEYTLGGMSDSTYEYLSKQYLLLGGRVDQYRLMYEQAMDVVKEHLLFRPMLPRENDILFSGKLNVPSHDDDKKVGDLTGENAHLTCFAGGMFGMGAMLFDRPDDLEIAKKLTEGCVFSYDMMPTGIMPESFEAVPCKNAEDCAWNETVYWQTIDPGAEHRLRTYKEELALYQSQFASASSWYEAQVAAMTALPVRSADTALPAPATPTTIYADTLDKRQLADLIDNAQPTTAPSNFAALKHDPPVGYFAEEADIETPTKSRNPSNTEDVAPEPSRTLPTFPYLYSPGVALNHEDFVKRKIERERLPPGVTRIGARHYILR
jgi:mannosyl-oligosaccharide alpha-1,2-mannosidase